MTSNANANANAKPASAKPANAKPAGMKYTTAVTRGRAAMVAQGKTNWTLGDIANAVETVTYKGRTIQRLAEEIGIEYRTLVDFRRVSRAYDAADRSDASWTVHAAFASESDRAELVKGTWSVSEARAEVARRKETAGNTTDGDSNGASEGSESTEGAAPAVSEIESARANVARLEGELIKARAHLAKLESAEPAPAAPALHIIKGIPSHDVSAKRADCHMCAKANGAKVAASAKPAAKVAATAKPAAKVAAKTAPAAGVRHARTARTLVAV